MAQPISNNIGLPTVTTHVTLGHGSPAGSIRLISGVETYATLPPSRSKENAILLFTDGYGIKADYNRLLADEFAANGYFVVMPDLFLKDPIPQTPDKDFDEELWKKRHEPASVDGYIKTVLAEMHKAGVQRIGGVGYSIGARYLARFMGPGKFCASFMGHPDKLGKEDAMAINTPVSIALGTEGTVSPGVRHETEKLLAGKELPYQITVFSRVANGFAVRPLTASPYHKFVRDETLRQALQWLSTFMKSNGQVV